MKIIKHIICFFLLLAGSFSGFAQSKSQQSEVKTISFKVSGNCDGCKERIENAADIKGVKLCVWDKESKIAKVTYLPSKVTPEQIKKAITAAGHDVEDEKASETSYKKLPTCCKYRDGECKEH